VIVLSILAILAMSLTPAKLVPLDAATSFPTSGQTLVRDFGTVDAGMDFNEAIVSWNVANPEAAGVTVWVKAIQNGTESKEFCLGSWSYDARLQPRASINGQADPSGSVLTDTLHLNMPAQKLEIRVALKTLSAGKTPDLKLLTVCFSNTKVAMEDAGVASPAWGKDISVPERAQNDYPNGGVLCSATTVSMVLWHYSLTLNRPELNQDVPAVEQGVWDTAYKGAGNWPFNTAYAGSFPGMRAYVSRFESISDLEQWIEAGIPVACSVSFDMLRGKPLSATESGHLILLTGFTSTGDPIVNDPAFKGSVHRAYDRADFEKAWNYSHRTVYLIYPESAKPPADLNSLWDDRISN
jgi:hypothetical protein